MKIGGKTALITGGATRVGREITMSLAKAGANVVINYHSSEEKAFETEKEVASYGIGTLLARGDVSDQQRMEVIFDEAIKKFGAVDILVNSASLFRQTPVPTRDFSDWHKVVSVLIDGAFYCSNYAAPKMIEKGEGAIINIVDLSAWEPWAGFAAHAVGKAALLALTRQLALDLAPQVRVNAVAPGPVLPPPHYNEEKIERTARKTVLDRWGSPHDVSEAVLFLIRSDYITGESITVDGGEKFGHRKHEEA